MDWLRLNRPNYDSSYQITALTERQAAEQLYLYQQAARLADLREKTEYSAYYVWYSDMERRVSPV
jgi:hypothetical protein